jgi:hypothetical protein
MESASEAAPGRARRIFYALGRLLAGLWEGFKGLATPVAAVSAFFASLTALGVYEGEERRNKFERMRHSYESYREFNVATAYRPTILPCLEGLLELDDKELPDLMKYNRELKFRYDPSRHAGLAACLRRDSQDEDPPAPEKWTLAETRLVRAKILPRIDALDTVLISYARDVGDPGFICENVIGIFSVGDGVVGRFLDKMIGTGIIHEKNYPNIVKFATDYSAKYAKGQPCPRPLDLQSSRNIVLDRYKSILDWAGGKLSW